MFRKNTYAINMPPEHFNPFKNCLRLDWWDIVRFSLETSSYEQEYQIRWIK
jgi:hypothetical protein